MAKIKGYSGSKTVEGIGGAMTSGGITQNGIDYTKEAPTTRDNFYGGGAFTRQGTIESSDVNSPYYVPTSPVAVISTAQAKSTIDSLQTDQTKDIERLTAEENNKKVNSDKFRKESEANDRRNGGLSAEELDAVGGTLNDYSYNQSSGLYVPKSQTTATTDEFDKTQAEIDKVFAMQEGLIDATTNAQMASIKQSYSDLTKEQREANDMSQKSFKSYAVRSGMDRYSGERTAMVQNAVVSKGIKNLAKIASLETQALAQAESARTEKKFTLFAKKRDELVELRKERQKTLDEIQKDIQKRKEEAYKAKIQSSRDSAIANLISQGITDPKQILQYLNYDEQGNLVGDITSKEVADTLKNLSPAGDIEKLSGATRDFYILKGMQQLPADISSLPENEQLFAYLAAEKKASTAPKAGTQPNKITFSEATAKGLPISTVGMTEDDIAESFNSPKAPAWFVEKLQAETNMKGDAATIPGKMTLAPDSQAVTDAWDSYRSIYLLGGKADKQSANHQKASQYFTETYEGLTQDEIDTLATQVETYVNGGMSYADAVEQTIKDIE